MVIWGFNKDVNPVILSSLQSGHALDYNLGKRTQVANLYYRLQLGKKNTSCKFIFLIISNFGLKFYWNICRFTDHLSLGYSAHKVWNLTDHINKQSFQDELAHVFQSYNCIKYMFQ